MINKVNHVRCPYCKNKRLFDVTKEGSGAVSIKCPICKNIVVIELEHSLCKNE